MTRSERKLFRAFAAAFYAIAAFALAPPVVAADPALVEAARREGEVVWYTTIIVDQAARPLAEAWAKKYPDIKLRWSRAPSVETALKILNESRVGRLQPDVFDGSTTIFPLLDAGLVDSYKAAEAKDYPADFRDPNGAWHSLNAYFLVPAYNPQNLPAADVPKKWEDLLDPKFAGRLATTMDESVDGPAGFVGMILGVMGEQRGMDYLRKLAAQKIVTAAPGQRASLDKIIGGEYPLGLMMYLHQIDFSRSKGAPIEWLKLDPAWATKNYLGLIKGAPHPNAGKLLIEFLLSEEGQKVLREAGYIPVHPNVPPSNPGLRPDGGKFNYATVSTDTIRQKLPEWTRIHRELFR